jgi:hypothetical protein
LIQSIRTVTKSWYRLQETMLLNSKTEVCSLPAAGHEENLKISYSD